MTTKTEDSCEVKYCREYRALTYYKYKVCQKHWEEHCNSIINLKQIFEIKDEECRDNNV